jgi:hypothetical protein
MSDFDERVIRNTIQDFCIKEKSLPTTPKLVLIIKRKIHFLWGSISLERVVKGLGYKWGKYQLKRKILVERADIVDWRPKYLLKIRSTGIKDGQYCILINYGLTAT